MKSVIATSFPSELYTSRISDFITRNCEIYKLPFIQFILQLREKSELRDKKSQLFYLFIQWRETSLPVNS